MAESPTPEVVTTKRRGFVPKGIIAAGETYGRVKQNVFDNRVYYKKSLGHPVIRRKGVSRRSTKVMTINTVLKGLAKSPEHPSIKCKGLHVPEVFLCRSEALRAALAAKGLAKA
jgi:hypothetical protein